MTTAACSRGRRSGARGTTAAATSATAPPIRASVQRMNAASGVGTSVLTTIACTAAWLTNSTPCPSSSAVVIARLTISAICQPPDPEPVGQQVADEDADRDPDGHLGDPAQPLAVGGAEADHRGDRGEERRRVVEDVGGDDPRDPGRDRRTAPICHAFARRRARRARSEVRPRATACSRCGAAAVP